MRPAILSLRIDVLSPLLRVMSLHLQVMLIMLLVFTVDGLVRGAHLRVGVVFALVSQR